MDAIRAKLLSECQMVSELRWYHSQVAMRERLGIKQSNKQEKLEWETL